MAKGFIIEDVGTTRENTKNEEKYIFLIVLSNGYIYGFNLLNITFKDLNLRYNLTNISLSNLCQIPTLLGIKLHIPTTHRR